jgi:hypothetical protein
MNDYRLDKTGQEVDNILNGAAMQTDLTAEKERAELAEQTLQGNIDNEVLARQQADQTLHGNIDAEALARQGAVSDEETRAKAAEKANADNITLAQQAIEAILLLIPSAATALNQLADKSFVNSSISTATATFRGTYNLVTDLSLSLSATHQQIGAALAGAIATADNNDYAFVQIPTSVDTPTEIAVTERYKFNGSVWEYEYDLNNSGFTSAQWEAINSGITALLVTKLGALPTAAELATALNGKQNVLTFDNVPVSGSDNPVKSGGLYTLFAAIDAMTPTGAGANNKLVAEDRLTSYVTGIINALDATFDLTSADGHVTFKMTQADGLITSVQILTSDIASASQVSTNTADIAALQAAYAGLTQSDIVIVSGALPSSGQQQNVIYRQPDPDHTPPQFYSDYMWNGSTWVLMAMYNNAIDDEPTKGSNNLVNSGGVFNNIGAFDISELNATENPHTLATYADLTFALNALPAEYRKGGMSVKFVQSSDNKYVQYRLMDQNFTTDVTQWQGVDTYAPAIAINEELHSTTINGISPIPHKVCVSAYNINLLNPILDKKLYFSGSAGSYSIVASEGNTAQYIPVEENTTYIIFESLGGFANNVMRYVFTADEPAVGVTVLSSGTVGRGNTITSPLGAKWLLYTSGSASIVDSISPAPFLKRGTTEQTPHIDYVPYEGKTVKIGSSNSSYTSYTFNNRGEIVVDSISPRMYVANDSYTGTLRMNYNSSVMEAVGINYYGYGDTFSMSLGKRQLGVQNAPLGIAIGSNNLSGQGYNCSKNLAIGWDNLSDCQGSYNIGIGYHSGFRVSTGEKNLGLGHESNDDLQEGSENVALGGWALKRNNVGSYNVAVGNNALHGDYGNNTHTEGHDFSRNVAIGHNSMQLVKSGASDNVAIGYNTSVKVDGSHQIAIGSGASASKNGQMVLGSTSITEVVMCGNKKIIFNQDGSVTWEAIS